jgi:hypothetical protein
MRIPVSAIVNINEKQWNSYTKAHLARVWRDVRPQ